jgi:hypothetical protein
MGFSGVAERIEDRGLGLLFAPSRMVFVVAGWLPRRRRGTKAKAGPPGKRGQNEGPEPVWELKDRHGS